MTITTFLHTPHKPRIQHPPYISTLTLSMLYTDGVEEKQKNKGKESLEQKKVDQQNEWPLVRGRRRLSVTPLVRGATAFGKSLQAAAAAAACILIHI